ncbi:MAG: biotin/lipoyl-containing protein [Planctomycetota bacterium]
MSVRYKVEVAGQTLEVEIQETVDGPQARVGDGPLRPASLTARPAPLHTLTWGAARCEVGLEPDADDPERVEVTLPGRSAQVATVQDARFAGLVRRGGAGGKKLKRVKSPMPGVVVEVRVEAGQTVEQGQVLLILEAMKMQNEIRAEGQGEVKQVAVAAGDSVAAGALLVQF